MDARLGERQADNAGSAAGALPDLDLINRIAPSLVVSTGHIEFYRGGRRERLAFAEVASDVERCAAALARAGIGPGDRVGFVGSNCYDFVVCDLACVWLTATAVPFDPNAKYDLHSLRADLDLRCILSDVSACLGEHSFVWPFSFWRSTEKTTAPPPARYAADDRFAIKFTSGSTNAPKALEASAASVNHRMKAVQALFQHAPGDRVLIFLPLYLLQQRYWIYSAILFGFDVIVVPPAMAIHALADAQPTVVMGVPAFFEALRSQFLAGARKKRSRRWALAAYRLANRLSGGGLARFGYRPFTRRLGGRIRYLWTGSAAAPLTTLEFFRDMGVPLLQGYGMNETCIVSKNHPGANRVGSAGRLLPGMRVSFDEDGQIIVRCDHPVTDRYLRCEAGESEAVFAQDGAIMTGDLGRLDADGYLWITGRKKEMIVLSSGRKVEPKKVEDALKRFPDIENCFVFGSERPFVVALIQPTPETPEAEVRSAVARANTSLAPEERIIRFVVKPGAFSIENGLLTSQHKLRRDLIARTFAEDIAGLYA